MIKLRPATLDDAARAAEVLLASRKTFQPYAPPAHTDDEVHEWMREVLVPAGGVIVACDESGVIGLIATSREAGISWVNQLFVVPGRTAQGIGTRLLEEALARLERPVQLYTFQANTRARAFYERHGFRAIAFSDGATNEERCPDVLYELST
jgi:GNAT superfamily N-acetyltransferase